MVRWQHQQDGMGMFWTMRLSKSPITVLAYAQASSMSGVLLQAADKRVMMPDCDFMIHHGSISIESNSMAAKSAIDFNDRLCKRMLQLFAERAILGKYFQERGYGISRIKSFIDRKIKDKSDWYMSAEEALYFGFCDGILGEKGFEDLDVIRRGKKFKL